MTVRPARLNAAIAVLFVIGSACFVLGSVPDYLDATGGWADGITYFVSSLFFTTASYFQLVQAQSPATTDVDRASQHLPVRARLGGWLPHNRSWLAAATQFPGTLFFNISTAAALTHNATAAETDRYVWRPDLFGSVLFLVSSSFGILAVGRLLRWDPPSLPWRISWVNMLGSVLFMASALASYVLPATDEVVSVRVGVAGTLFGALFFLAGAAPMFPAWRLGLRPLSSRVPGSPRTTEDPATETLRTRQPRRRSG